jgi:hypothetical protein
MAEYNHSLKIRLLVKSANDWQGLFITDNELGEYDSDLLALAAVQTNIATFLSTTILGQKNEIEITDVTDMTVGICKLSVTARVRQIDNGTVYNIKWSGFSTNAPYATLHSALTTKINNMLSSDLYAFNITEMIVEANPEYVPS